ncbi:B9 domain-containing protein 1, partial [Perkinsus olseni]
LRGRVRPSGGVVYISQFYSGLDPREFVLLGDGVCRGILGGSMSVQADDLVWNLPLGLTYRSTNPHGWPRHLKGLRLILTIEGDDWLGRRVVVGYGVVTVPTCPGRHVRTCFVYRPCSSTWQARVMGWLMDSPARLKDPRILAGNDGRDVLRVASSGLEVTVTFNIALKDVESTDYHFT